MGKYLNKHKALHVLIALFSVLFPASAHSQSDEATAIPESHHILIINSYHSGYSWTTSQNDGFVDTVQKHYPDAQLYYEFMDAKRVSVKNTESYFADFLAEKYAHIELDIVYATDDIALEFCMNNTQHAGLEEATIITSGINNAPLLNKASELGIYGVHQNEGTSETISFATKSYPQAKKIVIISDSTPVARDMAKTISEQCWLISDLPVINAPSGSLEDMADYISRHDADTIFILGIYVVDTQGHYYLPEEVANRFSEAAKGPLFDCHDLYSSAKGPVGGFINLGYDQGHAAAEMAVKILQGGDTSRLPKQILIPQRWVFSAPALKRFGIPRKAVPLDSLIQFKDDNIIESHPVESALVLLGIAAQSALIVFLLLNIKKRRAITHKVRENEAQLRLLIEHSPLAISISHLDGRILYLNKKYKELVGYTIEDLPDIDTLKRVTIPDPDYRKKIWTVIEDMIQDCRTLGIQAEPIEYKAIAKDGHEIEIEMHFAFVGELNFRVFNDITQRKKALRELEDATKAARAASEAKSHFLANVSHEIRTPMNGIMGMVQLLRETPIQGDQRDYIDTIQNSCELLVNVINDILDLSKIESGKLTLEKESVNLKPFLSSVTGLAAPGIELKGLEFVCDIDDALPEAVIIDPNRLKQVLLNLLVNATKFTDSGSVIFKVRGTGTPGSTGTLNFEITDTGIGIEKEQQAAVFEPFIQGDNSSTRRIGGTGLGLSISRRLVQMMGGEIQLVSEVGKGSTFSFDVHVAVVHTVENTSAPNERIDVRMGDNFPLNILLAEDNVVNQKVASMMLRKMGYTIAIANNGEEAFELSATQNFDVILMDIQMPVADGFEATRKIRSLLPSQKQPRIIALTAHALHDDITRCKEAGMDGHLAKPLRATILRNVLIDAYHDIRLRSLK